MANGQSRTQDLPNLGVQSEIDVVQRGTVSESSIMGAELEGRTKYAPVHILFKNAGIAILEKPDGPNISAQTFKTNVTGVAR